VGLTAQLERYLAADGIIVFVSRVEVDEPSYFYFDRWEEAFSPVFRQLSREMVADERPWRIVVFAGMKAPAPPEPAGRAAVLHVVGYARLPTGGLSRGP
jgi:hypothetical protein